ncbi:death-associated inhibitor of apoptosis 2 [Agrilus planipennis]|uniref:Death-associated inhibitor of apoptosis 2 n=1 Tax=Agrilus planipennis TaxID=224129 RepID=A0A1W4X4N2_AGRPL|nr:death-associated inhibitor of apoptosis 2 [Agrilus planipennis]
MNVEENRLQTFSDWPPDTAVNASRIAKAGFYYTKQALIVECFACKVQISTWNYGDQVMALHKRMSPNCPFVKDPSTSGNVPSILSSSSLSISPNPCDTPEFNPEILKDESVRLQTYTNWPKSDVVTPESLARAGFYYLKHQDKTKCAFCRGVCVGWEVDDNPDKEHQRHFPRCPFVQTVINPRLAVVTQTDTTQNPPVELNKDISLTNSNLIFHIDLAELGVNSHKGPHKTEFATVESRLRSFASWPEDLIQTPDSLAQAGFYYEGSGDQVRCFHCDGGLRHWDPQDDPWTEHARWFPKCAYVQLVKGNDFVRACAFEQDTAFGTEEEVPRRRSEPVQRREVSDREIQAHLNSEAGLAALSIGLHVGRVKQAIKEKLEQTGVGFSTADALIEATLNLQREEEDISEPSSTQISQEASRLLSEVLENCIPPVSQQQETSETVPKDDVNDGTAKDVGNDTELKEVSIMKVPKMLSLEEENRLLKEARLCKICMDFEVGIVFLPCGHLTTCVNCAPNLKNCPVCRSAIKATVRTFLS